MIEVFKSEDFHSPTLFQQYVGSPVSGKTVLCSQAADAANKKLSSLIESWPVVYGVKGACDWDRNQDKVDTHKARLAFIEEIVKEPKKPRTLADVLNDHLTPDQMTEAFKFGEQIASLVKLKIIAEKEPCKHEPEHIFIGPETGNWSTKCKHCGVALFPTWSEKK